MDAPALSKKDRRAAKGEGAGTVGASGGVPGGGGGVPPHPRAPSKATIPCRKGGECVDPKCPFQHPPKVVAPPPTKASRPLDATGLIHLRAADPGLAWKQGDLGMGGWLKGTVEAFLASTTLPARDLEVALGKLMDSALRSLPLPGVHTLGRAVRACASGLRSSLDTPEGRATLAATVRAAIDRRVGVQGALASGVEVTVASSSSSTSTSSSSSSSSRELLSLGPGDHVVVIGEGSAAVEECLMRVHRACVGGAGALVAGSAAAALAAPVTATATPLPGTSYPPHTTISVTCVQLQEEAKAGLLWQRLAASGIPLTLCPYTSLAAAFASAPTTTTASATAPRTLLLLGCAGVFGDGSALVAAGGVGAARLAGLYGATTVVCAESFKLSERVIAGPGDATLVNLVQRGVAGTPSGAAPSPAPPTTTTTPIVPAKKGGKGGGGGGGGAAATLSPAEAMAKLPWKDEPPTFSPASAAGAGSGGVVHGVCAHFDVLPPSLCRGFLTEVTPNLIPPAAIASLIRAIGEANEEEEEDGEEEEEEEEEGEEDGEEEEGGEEEEEEDE